MNISEIVGNFVNEKTALTDLSRNCAKALGAEMVLICESYARVSIELSDSFETTPQLIDCQEYDLFTLGYFCQNPEYCLQFKKMQQENKNQGWLHHAQHKSAFFTNVCQGTPMFLNADDVKSSSNIGAIPFAHPQIRNLIGLPINDIRSNRQKIIGLIIIANFDESEIKCSSEHVMPLIETCINTIRMVLSYKIHAHMHKVYESVLSHIQTPIVVFQQRPNYNDKDLSGFYCFMHNDAFSSQILKNQRKSLVGGTLFQCFPQLQKTNKLLVALTNMFSTTELNTVVQFEAIEYEDMFIPKSTYTIKFSKVDSSTFIFSIENISDQIRAKILAEEIAQAKEQFVANVSHEIRTPLNGILGYIAMMSDPNEINMMTDYQKNCFMQIKDCSMNLLYIMNDILDFSKLNADQMQLKNEPFELTELLERSYDVVLPSAREKGIEMAFLIDPNVPPRLKGDFKKIKQILLNLLSNGLKFTPKGRVDTIVKIVKDDVTGTDVDVRGRTTLEFCVQDTGIGISPKDQGKLFKPFSQIDQSNKKIYQGTGLGLIISRKLAELMGGKIWVESKLGEGSKFYFTIKMEETRNTSPEIKAKFLPLVKDKVVLIVDDHATNRITISSYLLRWGMKPVICGSAEEALLYLRGSVMQFDMALIDIRMPNMDGNELAAKINILTPELPLVAISSQPLGTNEIGKFFSFYLNKPIRHRQLFNVCLAVVKQQNNKKLKSPLSPTKQNVLTSPIDPELASSRKGSFPGRCSNLNRSFLIVEDLVTNQRVAVGFLQKLGFSDFTVAEDGPTAIELVRKKHYDVIFMDLKMPGMNGYDITKRIRQITSQRPFIIALTANAMGGVREKCMEAGMDAYITKPIDILELARLLNEA